MKKILCLILAFAMAFSVVSAASFTDEDAIGTNYIDDVNMLVQLGVIDGYPDGSFGPQNYITRAEFAKMAYTLKYGSDNAGNLFAGQPSAFTDVANDNWAKGYINYCANQNIVSGVGNGKFNPNGNITVAEATKMILVILGCDPVKEGFVGSNWAANTVSTAIELGVYDGWTGDPTQFATRELVAKLMRNAVFSPVYEYSAITGTGSQMNVFGDENATLGEKIMGLKSVNGIVVANENYAISTDPEGDDILLTVSPTNDEDESVIYYMVKDSDGDNHPYLITIDRGLPSDMLGCKVNVYFRADSSNTARYDYKNVEVIGDVLVDSDTVVHTVPASAIEIYPNGDSNSKTEITPYIAFGNIEISADRKIGKVAKDTDAATIAAVKEHFASYGYVFNNGLKKATVDTFINDIGANELVDYRFVSVDGGKTYSYIFKSEKYKYGAVTSYNKGVIRISGVGTIDIEDAIIDGDFDVDDYVVCRFVDEKTIISPVEIVIGAVDNYGEGSIYIDGVEYKAWSECNKIDSDKTIVDYMMAHKKFASDSNATYYTYNGLILDIDDEITTTIADDYAVILRSNYDEVMDTATVKLGFADGTTGTYEVSKTYLANRREPYSEKNKGNRASDFANNAYVGYVVDYKITAGGVDLSAQDFGTDVKSYAEAPVIADGKIGGNYPYNNASVLFVLKGTGAQTKHYVYNLADIEALGGLEIVGADKYGYYVSDVNRGVNFVLAASVRTSEKPSYDESKDVAYVVTATQKYNITNDTYYLELDMITVGGQMTVATVEDVEDFAGNVVLENNVMGRIKAYEGALINYEFDGEFITKFDVVEDYKKVTVLGERLGRVSYVDYSESAITITDGVIKTEEYDEDGYDIITIDEDEYVGESLVKIPASLDELEAKYYNAYLVIGNDGITTIFSFIQ